MELVQRSSGDRDSSRNGTRVLVAEVLQRGKAVWRERCGGRGVEGQVWKERCGGTGVEGQMSRAGARVKGTADRGRGGREREREGGVRVEVAGEDSG